MTYREKETAKPTALDIKQMNRSNIYMLLHRTGGQSRQAIANTLGLSLPTVVQNLTRMQQEGLVRDSGFQGNTGGRRAALYSVVPDARVAIGLDITTCRASAVVVDLQGNLIAQRVLDIPFSRTEGYYARVGALVSGLPVPDRDRVLGVGISLPGLISADGGSSYYCRVLGVDGITRGEFQRDIPYPVCLCHDVAALAFAESWQNQTDSFFYMMLSGSIGGAVFLNGTVYTGANHRSGEIGHMQLVENGRLCYCGRRGCADSYCSSKPLTALTDGDLPAFFALLEKGDPSAAGIWDAYLHSLARVIHNLRMLFDCRIILGGHVGEYMEAYLPRLQALTRELDPFQDEAGYLTLCRVKTQASAVGAALQYIDRFVDSI